MSFVRALVVSLILLLLVAPAWAQQDAGDIEDLLADLADTPEAEAEDAMSMGEEPVAEEGAAEEVEATEASEPAPAVVETADVEEEVAPVVPVDPAELEASAAEMADAMVVRIQANEKEGSRRLAAGYDALSDEDYEQALAEFEATLRLLSDRPENAKALKSARRGHADADYELAKIQLEAGDVAAARRSADRAVQFVPTHRGANRLVKKMEKETDAGYVMPAKRDEFVRDHEQITFLLKEGRDLFENAEYNKAEERFEAIRLMDEYNVEAMKWLTRIEQRRYELEDIERERTKEALLTMVRGHWNPPLELYVKPPEDLRPKDEVERVTDAETQALLDKMDAIEIPALEFRDANIIDVIDILRRESEKADEEGIGINMVLKLTVGGPTATANIPTEGFAPMMPSTAGNEFGFGPGGGGGEFGGEFDGGFGGPTGGDMFDPGFGNLDEFGDPTAAPMQSTQVEVPDVTLSLRRVTLLDALQIITEYSNLKFKVERGIVFISPIALIEDLETRVYAVQPSLLEIVVEKIENNYGGSGGSGGRGGSSRGGSSRGGSGGSSRGGSGGGGSGDFIEMGGEVEMTRQDVRSFFQEAGVPFPPGTSIKFNPSTSQLIVRNTVENLEIFERLLPHFNKPPPQVEIEARFVEILQSDLQALGLEWILTDDWELASRGNGPVATRERIQFNEEDQGFTQGLRYMSETATGLIPAARAAGTLTQEFAGDILSFSSILTNPELSVILHAIDQSGGSDLLSAPRVTTRSGLAAEIQVVREIIYPTEFEAEVRDVVIGTNADGDPIQGSETIIVPSNFETREVGVILNVTPTVGPDGYTIDLTLAPEVAELVDWIQYGSGQDNIPQPVFASRNATTSILVWDGQTVVMGGLINEQITRNDDKIPILGDIPLIGYLFRSEGERSVKRNLLIFVTARIVDPAGRPVNNLDAPIAVGAGGAVVGS